MKEDLKLIKDIFHHRPDAVESLYDRFAPSLLSLCYRYAGNRQDAEDILHDGFIKILKNLPDFRPRHESSLEAWMRKIMTNTALNYLRDRVKDRKIIDIERIEDKFGLKEAEEDYSALDPIPLSSGEILEMIAELPAGYRAVFNLYVFEEYSHKEISEMLNCTEGTTKSQLSKARALLRARISETVNIYNNR